VPITGFIAPTDDVVVFTMHNDSLGDIEAEKDERVTFE
jgi:hypothetical protein